ncbi:chaperone modulator CbpM [Chitinophaga rhizophila]|uniref:Chaperone modulator CbpM n=1 Tax=Chitinophaga rhizophila TaxID=2866212 RepID=A0ABS7G543_9BACT|nr:chaperone modulator CbpM [Chitinophaga rhizophila]MBW8682780.1 chaperone modulator CbpM [Chitinophaga rhizophila]
MQATLIAIQQYCSVHEIESNFVDSLADEGLIAITVVEGNSFVSEEQLQDLELYTRWYHEMGVNTAGIDVIRHLLDRIRHMQMEISHLRARLHLYEGL